MFLLLGRTIRRAWLVVLAVWAVLLAVSWHLAPSWNDVAQDKEFAFLPADAPSRVAEEVFAKAFPDDHLPSNIVVVLHRAQPEPKSRERDLSFIADILEPRLRQFAEAEGGLANAVEPTEEPLFGDDTAAPAKPQHRSIIARIRTPNAVGVGALLESADHQAMLAVIELTTEFLSSSNWPTITKIENLVADLQRQGEVPPGLEITVTGSAVIGRDRTQAQLQSAHATETLTVVLVIILLIGIYRAPLLALIPLATVFLAVKLAINLLAILGGAGYITLFQGIQIYITILAYGAGVDYCLFLTARYKEELERGLIPAEAVAHAVGGVGAALVASAATVICGIAMMIFAQFGKFHEAGIAIPFSLLLVLLATLTFSPSLLRLAGRWAFWPQRPGPDTGANASPAPAGRWDWLVRASAFQRGWEKVGHMLLHRPGIIWLTTVIVMAPFAVAAGLLYNQLSYDLIGNLPADAPSVVGTRVLQDHFPAGLMGPVTVLLINSNLDFQRDEDRQLVEQLTQRLREQKEHLGLADLRSLTAPLGTTAAAERGAIDLEVPEKTRRQALQEGALERYVTDMGGRTKIGTRLDLILQRSPFSRQSVADLNRVQQVIEDALPAHLRESSQIYLLGPTASIRDLQMVVRSDRTRIEILVLASVLLVLLVLLRRIAISLYLLLSVLFSYYATLGVTFAVFWLFDPHGFTGIDWKVAIFLFTILIAVGEDYNIFLMARIHEEQRRHGPVRGIVESLLRTGPIISSCGFIMAGTFASMLAGSLSEMKQLGFALAFGILLDTFVVRPILVPSFLIWLFQGSEAKPADIAVTERLLRAPAQPSTSYRGV